MLTLLLGQNFNSIPEILLSAHKHKTNINPYCRQKEPINEQIGGQRKESFSVIGNFFFYYPVRVNHDKETDPCQRGGNEEFDKR